MANAPSSATPPLTSVASAAVAGNSGSNSTLINQGTLFVANGRYRLTRLLGKGGFGEVYEGFDTQAPELRVAVKVERRRRNKYLYHEACVIDRLAKFVEITVGFPAVHYYGDEGDYSVMVMNLLGPSLEDLLDVFGHFSIKTVVMLGLQMVARLEYMHSVGFIHRDIKPENFTLGIDKLSHHVYLIDYGLSTRYRSSNGHRPLATGRALIGTCRYASLRTHEGLSQSRRDDLEQLAYTLVYIRRGKLPWTGLKVSNQQMKEKKVMEMKQSLSLDVICKRCPSQFEDLLLYSRKMGHEDAPRYEMVSALLQSVLDDNHWKNDYQFDWVPHKQSSPKSQGSVSNGQPPPPPRSGEDDRLLLSMSLQDGLVFSNADACGMSGLMEDQERPLSPLTSPLASPPGEPDDALIPQHDVNGGPLTPEPFVTSRT